MQPSDERDRNDDGDWVRARAAQERFTGTVDATEVDAVREVAYITTFTSTTPNSSDLAACVSDDFDLIAHSLLHGMDDPWINGLLAAYLNAEVPTSPVAFNTTSPAVQIERLLE